MMSRKLVTLVYERRIGSLLRKAVLACMADRANDDGTGIWISKSRIADEIEASRRSVITVVQEFVDEELLFDHGYRGRKTIEYSMNVPAVEALPKSRAYPVQICTPNQKSPVQIFTPTQNLPVQICTLTVNPFHSDCEPGSHKPSFNRQLKEEGTDLINSVPDEQTLSAMRAQGLSSPVGQSWLSVIDTLRQRGKLSLRDKDDFKRAVQGVDGDDLILSEDYEPPEALLQFMELAQHIEGEEA